MDNKLKFTIIGAILLALVLIGTFYTLKRDKDEIKADFTTRETNRVVVIPPTYTKGNVKPVQTTSEPYEPPAAHGGR